MNKETIIAELKKLKPVLAEKYSVQDIALFGSYSRNEATSKSDIDILIHFKEPTYNSLCKSFDILQDVFGDITVQLVSRGGIKPQYFNAIKPDLLYA
jgi:predicted nucleotidyltransferase